MIQCKKCDKWFTETSGGVPIHDCTPILHRGQPYVCPVCRGTGLVKNGFYALGGTASTLGCEPCRSCNGTGVIWDDALITRS